MVILRIVNNIATWFLPWPWLDVIDENNSKKSFSSTNMSCQESPLFVLNGRDSPDRVPPAVTKDDATTRVKNCEGEIRVW